MNTGYALAVLRGDNLNGYTIIEAQLQRIKDYNSMRYYVTSIRLRAMKMSENPKCSKAEETLLCC